MDIQNNNEIQLGGKRAKKAGSKKVKKTASKKVAKKGSKKSSKKMSSKSVKSGSKKTMQHKISKAKTMSRKMSGGSDKPKRKANTFMLTLMAVKKHIKKHNTEIKDGPVLSKVVSAYLKEADRNEKKAIEIYEKEHKNGSFMKDYNKAAKEMADKRKMKNASKSKSKE
jgi:hypothetical protein